MAAAGDHALLYDADCGFCTRSVRRLLRLDRRGRLRPVPIQSEEGRRLLSPMPEWQQRASWHLVFPDGTVRSGGSAAAPLVRLLPAGGPMARLLAAFPRLTDRAYAWVADHRDWLGRFLAAVVAVALVGCGSAVQEGSELTVYLSGPERGPEAAVWRDVSDGAALAHSEAGGEAAGVPIRVVELDDAEPRGVGWTQASVAANARAATEDSTAIAYIGELETDATRISVPITNEAGLLQVAPIAVDEDLLRDAPGSNDVPTEIQTSGERTFGALVVRARPSASLPIPDPAFARRFREEFGRRPGPSAAYGYEAMALVLDSIGRASDPLDRGAVIAAFLATSERASILGDYSVDQAGAATIGGS